MPQHWLIKSEPSVYAYSQLVTERRTAWTGVRNFEARNNLRLMKKGDLALYYHSGDEKALVGVAKILSAAKSDPTAPGEDWSAVDVAPLKALNRPVTLAAVKASKALANFPLVTRSRLSVAKVDSKHFALILELAATKL